MPVPTKFNYVSYKAYFKTATTKRGRKQTELNEYNTNKLKVIVDIQTKYSEKYTEFAFVKDQMKLIEAKKGRNN